MFQLVLDFAAWMQTLTSDIPLTLLIAIPQLECVINTTTTSAPNSIANRASVIPDSEWYELIE